MSLNSMTGFARVADTFQDWSWSWELKSVNAKGLDIRFRTPIGYDSIDAQGRALLTKTFTRGTINAGLVLNRAAGESRYRLNEEQLENVVAAARALADKMPDAAAPTIDGLLNVRGVIEADEEGVDEAVRKELEAAILSSLSAAASALADVRREEGEKLAEVLKGFVDNMRTLHAAAAASTESQPEVLKTRLKEQIATLVDEVSTLDQGRLEQELAILMTKADITEEIDRFVAHLQSATELMTEGGAIGRRLDFLCQELNREANTICSKASDTALTRIGLDMKATVEQFREQVQNIE